MTRTWLNRPPYLHSSGDTGTPRWVKIFAIIALVPVLLIVSMMFIGGGDHGLGRHTRSIEHGVQKS
jgi:hypothetical protein